MQKAEAEMEGFRTTGEEVGWEERVCLRVGRESVEGSRKRVWGMGKCAASRSRR